ncbi:MAG TPA: hypothetical protein VJ501_06095 [Burkholderiaceae bacterium]|nr:hypothetical protein [Burkholderiaceae bacterium]
MLSEESLREPPRSRSLFAHQERLFSDPRERHVAFVPFLAPFFDTVPLTSGDWLVMLPFFFMSPLAMELLKVYFRHTRAGADAGAPAAPLPGEAQPRARPFFRES